MSYNPNRGGMLRKPRSQQGFDPNKPALQNIDVAIEAIHIARPGRTTPWSLELQELTDKDPNGKVHFDYADVYLLHDVPEIGLTATFVEPEGAEGQGQAVPATKMRLLMPLPRKDGQVMTESERRDLYGLTQKVGAGGPLDKPGDIVHFEKVWVRSDMNGTLFAHYSRGGPSFADQAAGLKVSIPGMMICVMPEGEKRDAKGQPQLNENRQPIPAGYQDAMFTDTASGQIITTQDELRAAIENTLSFTQIGTPGFQVHARRIAPGGMSHEDAVAWAADPETRQAGYLVAKGRPTDQSDPDTGRRIYTPMTGEEAQTRFARFFPNVVDKIGNPEWDVEFLPMTCVTQAASLTPSRAKKGQKVRDNSQMFRIFDGPEGETPAVIDYGWGVGTMATERRSSDGPWYGTYQNLMSTRGTLFMLPDIPTTLMGERCPYHAEAVRTEAARLVQQKQAFHKANKAADPDHDAEPAPAAGPGR